MRVYAVVRIPKQMHSILLKEIAGQLCYRSGRADQLERLIELQGGNEESVHLIPARA
jgi:hypothetical protein